MTTWFTPSRNEAEAAAAGFRLSTDGLIFFNTGRSEPYHSYPDKHGYPTTKIHLNSRRITMRLGRFQAYLKYGEELYAAGIVTRHRDGNPANSHWDNILIGTQHDNMMDQPKELRQRKSSEANRLHDHPAIIAHYRQHGWGSALRTFGIRSRGTLSFIINKSMTVKSA